MDDSHAFNQIHRISSDRRTSPNASPLILSTRPLHSAIDHEEVKMDDARSSFRTMQKSTSRSNYLNGTSGSSASLSPMAVGRTSSPMGTTYNLGDSLPLRVPSQSRSRGDALSPSFSNTALSPSLSPALSSTSHSHLSIPSNTSASGSSRTNYASASSHFMFGASPTRPQQASSMRNSSNNSDHSRHSSGAGSASVFPGYGGGINLYGSVTSHSTGGSASGSFNTDNSIDLSSSRKGSGMANVSIGSLASALARSNLSESAAIQMVNSASHGSNAESSLGHANLSSSLPRPSFSRQALSDGSSSNPASINHSTSPVPVSLPTTGPLSAADLRTQLHISNLPFRVRWQDVKDLFRKAGIVLRADVSLTIDNRSRGFGSVLMATEDDAKRACDMFNGFNWQGRTLDVQIDRSGTLLGIGVSQTINPTLALGNVAEPSPTHLPLGTSPGAAFNLDSSAQLSPNGTHLGSLRIGAQHPAQNSSGVSPALLPFLGATSRGSLSGPSSTAMQTGYSPNQRTTNGALNQQRSSISAGPLLDAAPMGQNHSQVASPFVSQHQVASPQFTPANQMYMQQQPHHPTFISQYLAPAPMQSYGSNPIPRSMMAGSSAQMMNSISNMNLPYLSSSPIPPSLPQLPPAHSYYGRVLFVGNLPFHCQWQDLKDLFRAAGHIQRADVALSAEGKSRGFGTVLFSTPEDAQNAVRIYHGYEYSGRTLKVHFDRFAQMTIPVSGALPASPSEYTGAFAAANVPTTVSSSSASHTQTQQIQHQQKNEPSKDLYPSNIEKTGNAQGSFSPLAIETGQQSDQASSQGVKSQSGLGISKVPSGCEVSSSNNAKSSNIRPGRISLPPQAFPAYPNQNIGQFSPLSTRMNVPMTPGMPGFTFHALSPTTSPIHPQILSPGLNGPFSPLLGSPLYGGQATPGAGSSAFNPHLNHAPGAPIYFANGLTTPISNVMAVPPGYNPMFPPVEATYPMNQQAAAYLPSQQQGYHVPPTPHWNQPRPPTQVRKQSKPVPTRETSTMDTIAGISKDVNDSVKVVKAAEDAEEKEGRKANLKVEDLEIKSNDDKNSYFFPLVQPTSSALLQRRASTNSPAHSPIQTQFGSIMSSNIPPKSPGWELRRGSIASSKTSEGTTSSTAFSGGGGDLSQIHAVAGSHSTEELARKIAQMSTQKVLRQKSLEKAIE